MADLSGPIAVGVAILVVSLLGYEGNKKLSESFETSVAGASRRTVNFIGLALVSAGLLSFFMVGISVIKGQLLVIVSLGSYLLALAVLLIDKSGDKFRYITLLMVVNLFLMFIEPVS